jgi:drug/metabolite transporter (DMT)-like permease
VAAIALALSSSALWGLADFLGGLKSRTLPVPVVLGSMYLASLTVMAVFVAARGEAPPATGAVAASLGAGVLGILGLSAFYRALAIGTMSIVAPIAATGVALPVLVGIATGDRPGLVRSVGLAAAVVGIVLASREDDGGAVDARQQRQSVVLAILAGVGFGSYFVLAEIGADADVAWALALSRFAAAPFIIGVAVLALRPGGWRPRGREIAALGAIGLLDLGANAAYNYATTIGELSTIAVGSSLYPVMTVFMAALVLGERVRGVQRVGVVVALSGVVLIAAGG